MYWAAVLLEQLDDRLELLALGVGRRVLDVGDVLEIAAFDDVSEAVPLAVLPQPLVDLLTQLGIVLAERDGQHAAGAHRNVAVHVEIGEHLLPEAGQIVVDDGDRRETGIDHLEHVIVLENIGGLVNHHGRLAARGELLVQPDEAVVIGAQLANEHLAAGQVVHGGDRRRTGPGDHDLTHVGAGRLREGHELLELGPDGLHGRHHVDRAA